MYAAIVPDCQIFRRECLACSASDMGVKDAFISYQNNAELAHWLRQTS